MLNIRFVIWSAVTMSIFRKICNSETRLETLNILQFETSIGHVYYEPLQHIGKIESQIIGKLGATEFKTYEAITDLGATQFKASCSLNKYNKILSFYLLLKTSFEGS